MNLIYINTHDSGRYFTPYGYAVDTPAIMALARQSTLFRSAFCAAPTCSPSRAAMLTGLSAHESGMMGLAHRGFTLAQPKRHLAWYLRGQGFETALCGIQHEAVTAEELGYEQIISSDREAQWPDNDILNADAACEFLLKKHDRPFLLSFGMQCTHRIYPVDPERFNPDYVMPPPTVPDTSETREDFAGYLCSVNIADRCVAKLLKAVDEAGLAEDTVVLFTTDHGLPFPGMKCSLHDPGIAVALMLRFPQNPAAGTATDALVSQLDVYPTICDLLSVPKPEWLEGYSLLPVIERGEEVRDELFAEVTYHAAYEPKRCVRTKRWKYIRHFDLHNRVVSANTDDSASKRLLWAAGWRERPVPREELYDLICDPAEKHNLVDDPAHQEEFGEMVRRLQQWMERTNDPLLTQAPRVPKPTGARINTLDSTHPTDINFED